MGQSGQELGFSIKFWKLEWVAHLNDFRARDTVSFVFQDRPPEEISRLGSLIEEIAANSALGKVADILSVKQEIRDEDDQVPKVKKEKKDSDNDDDEFDPNQYFPTTKYNGKREPESDVEDSKANIITGHMCNYCGDSFGTRKRLKSHLYTCNPDHVESEEEPSSAEEDYKPIRKKRKRKEIVEWSCDNCLKQFNHRSTLAKHLESCYPDQLEDLPLPLKKKKSGEKAKVSTVGAGPYTCTVCSRQFIFRKSLAKHMDTHGEDSEYIVSKKTGKLRRKKKQTDKNIRGQFQCDRCECDFKIYGALQRHMLSHELAAKNPPTMADIEEGSGFKMIDIRDGKIMRCKRCDLAFKSHGVYRMHMQKFHKKMFGCEDCSKKFTLPNTLVKHRLNYHATFPKSCPDCGLVLTTKHQFVRHVNTMHGTAFVESNVPCEICGKLVKNKYTLKQHVKLVHEKKKGEFACDQCGKVLKSKGSLDYHKRTHTGEMAYRCDECGRGHMRYDKMMECLAEHAGIHKYQCPHCEYKSNQLGYFKKHLTTHSDAKPFTCPICGHNSSTSTNLNGHTKKVHKITLCQAEGMMKRNRHGKEMTEEELEQNRITLQRNQKVPGEPSRLVAEARKRGKPNRTNNQNNGAGQAVVNHQHNPAAVAANQHDAATAQQNWEANMARIEAARIEANLRQDMMNRHDMARAQHDLGRQLQEHHRIENLSRDEGAIPKQERNLEEAANLVMPRHMLFPVHKYFQ